TDLSPVFRSIVERCDAVMGLDRSLAQIFNDGALLARTDYAQPALYALSAGLGALWRSWGIEPGAVRGHSVGEYAAAHLAGVLTLEDGARLIAARGRLMQALRAGGGMAALLGNEAAVRGLLVRHPDGDDGGGTCCGDRPAAGRSGAERRHGRAEAHGLACLPLEAARADARRAGGDGQPGGARTGDAAGGGQ